MVDHVLFDITNSFTRNNNAILNQLDVYHDHELYQRYRFDKDGMEYYILLT